MGDADWRADNIRSIDCFSAARRICHWPSDMPIATATMAATNGIHLNRNLIGITILPCSMHPRQPALFGQLAAPPIIMKILVAAAFVLILASLGSALVFLMRDKGKSNRTVKALAFRVGFSIALFLLILIAY